MRVIGGPYSRTTSAARQGRKKEARCEDHQLNEVFGIDVEVGGQPSRGCDH